MPFCLTGQVFWLEYIVFAPKHMDSIFRGPGKKWKILSKEKKNTCKICTKISLVPAGQEFRPECNVNIFARKFVDSIVRGLTNKCKILKKKKNKKRKSGKICTKIPFGPKGLEFWLEYNVVVFYPKLVDSIFSGPRNKWKILSKENKIQEIFLRKYPLFRLV